MMNFLARESREFLYTSLVLDDSSGRNIHGANKKAAFYSPQELGLLAQKLDSVDMCFMIVGLGGDGCKNMLQLACELRKRGIMTVALTVFPFRFENLAEKAEAHLHKLEENLDVVLVFDNDSLTRNLGRSSCLTAGLEVMTCTMRDCLKAMNPNEYYDVADLRAFLYGRVYYGIGHSDKNHMQALRNAVNMLKKEFQPDFRIDSGLLRLCFKEMEDLRGCGGEIRDLMDTDNVLWLVSFGIPVRMDCSSVTILACGQHTLQDSPDGLV